MIQHLTKNKGDLGVLKAQADLAEQGYLILHPLTEHAPFDLVAYKDGKFKRIQVKYRTLTNRGNLEIKLSTNWSDKKGNHVKDIDKTQIDNICVYCPETDKCYYFDPNQSNKCLTLRINPPKNNQQKNVFLADNYRKISCP